MRTEMQQQQEWFFLQNEDEPQMQKIFLARSWFGVRSLLYETDIGCPNQPNARLNPMHD